MGLLGDLYWNNEVLWKVSDKLYKKKEVGKLPKYTTKSSFEILLDFTIYDVTKKIKKY